LKLGVRKNAAHTLFAGKGEGACLQGQVAAAVEHVQTWRATALKPGIFIELAPTGEGEASA
jgi:hypothetical protein